MATALYENIELAGEKKKRKHRTAVFSLICDQAGTRVRGSARDDVVAGVLAKLAHRIDL